jgi:hypothetical protein
MAKIEGTHGRVDIFGGRALEGDISITVSRVRSHVRQHSLPRFATGVPRLSRHTRHGLSWLTLLALQTPRSAGHVAMMLVSFSAQVVRSCINTLKLARLTDRCFPRQAAMSCPPAGQPPSRLRPGLSSCVGRHPAPRGSIGASRDASNLSADTFLTPPRGDAPVWTPLCIAVIALASRGGGNRAAAAIARRRQSRGGGNRAAAAIARRESSGGNRAAARAAGRAKRTPTPDALRGASRGTRRRLARRGRGGGGPRCPRDWARTFCNRQVGANGRAPPTVVQAAH